MSQPRCGYCHSSIERWRRSPQGRRYCPECGAIPKAEQNEFDGDVFKDY